jgi:hypothetical protein
MEDLSLSRTWTGRSEIGRIARLLAVGTVRYNVWRSKGYARVLFPVSLQKQRVADQSRLKPHLGRVESQKDGALEERHGAVHYLKSSRRHLGKSLFEKLGLTQGIGVEFILEATDLRFHAAFLGNFGKSRRNEPDYARFVAYGMEVRYPATRFGASG